MALTMGFIDFTYLLFLAPAMLLAFIAQRMVASRFDWASKLMAPRGLTGREVARLIADHHGLQGVPIEPSEGHLSDHYDPRSKTLRLSPQVYSGRSLAAYAVAAHEVGHAIQDQTRYAPLVVRNAIVGTAGFGSNAGMLIFMGGLMLSAFTKSPGLDQMAKYIMIGGIALFSAVVFFQLVNLITEFDASARAKLALAEMGLVSQEEAGPVSKVLSAAALTYVAGTLSAILTLAYLVFRFSQSQRQE
jgi:Zn-dependent membrane protease YugP